jgi:hypothetical protein
MSIEIRIFLGYLENKELKMHLNQSPIWQEAKMLGLGGLIETRWQEEDYIGSFVPSFLNYIQLKDKESEIKNQLQLYCPKLNIDRHPAYLFSQLFLF